MKKLNFKEIGKRAVGVAAGGAAGTLINKVLPAGVSPKMASLGKIVAGLVLPEFAPKNKMLADAGTAFAAVGVSELTNTMTSKGTGVQGIADPEYVVQGNEYEVAGNEVAVQGNEVAVMGNGNDDEESY